MCHKGSKEANNEWEISLSALAGGRDGKLRAPIE